MSGAAGGPDSQPFPNGAISRRAIRSRNPTGLQPIGFHECVHTCASVWIAAALNTKASTTFTSHANISTTFDLSGYLTPGGDGDALVLVDAFYAQPAASPVGPAGATVASQ